MKRVLLGLVAGLLIGALAVLYFLGRPRTGSLPGTALRPPDAASSSSGTVTVTIDEKFFAGLHANGVTDHKLEVIDAGGDDKVVYGTANWSAKGKDKDGKPANFSGIATHVFERQADGSLKLRLHTFN